jgi:RimJ/RimL family protein N-acetyltransferase
MTEVDYRIIMERRQADIKSLAAISVLDNDNPETLAAVIEYFRTELEGLDPKERLLVAAFAGAELVGFCRFQVCPRLGLWWCRGLQVVSEWQRRGIGSSLLRAAISHLASSGETDIRSDASTTNTASKATQKTAGFRPVSTQGEDFDGTWREDHVFLQWRSGKGTDGDSRG